MNLDVAVSPGWSAGLGLDDVPEWAATDPGIGGRAKILIARQERASRVTLPEQLDRLAGRSSGDVVLLLELVLQRDRPTGVNQVGRIIIGDYDISGAEDSSQANG